LESSRNQCIPEDSGSIGMGMVRNKSIFSHFIILIMPLAPRLLHFLNKWSE
jgi:hypothetical protein